MNFQRVWRSIQTKRFGQYRRFVGCTTVPHSSATDGAPQSEIYRRGIVENDWNSLVARRYPSKAIIGFPINSNAGSAAFPMLALVGNARDSCFKIVGIPIKACDAQLSFDLFPLTNKYWHH